MSDRHAERHAHLNYVGPHEMHGMAFMAAHDDDAAEAAEKRQGMPQAGPQMGSQSGSGPQAASEARPAVDREAGPQAGAGNGPGAEGRHGQPIPGYDPRAAAFAPPPGMAYAGQQAGPPPGYGPPFAYAAAPPPGMAYAGQQVGPPPGYGPPPFAYTAAPPPGPAHGMSAPVYYPGLGGYGAPFPGPAPVGYGPGAPHQVGRGPGGSAGQGGQHQGQGVSGLVEEIANGGNGLSSLSRLLNLDDWEFWKGAAIGAAAVMLLTNESVQKMLFRTSVKARDTFRDGVEKVQQTVRAHQEKDPGEKPSDA
ncbi:MAG: hypothetical protein H6970_13260 [Gammaproteobacteria bacterium]|nr:hypothetical protein [Gammaproteobacteria bacterium]MCP5458668.1 hypothetical protein [Gammaproteobacteria bacterium]